MNDAKLTDDIEFWRNKYLRKKKELIETWFSKSLAKYHDVARAEAEVQWLKDDLKQLEKSIAKKYNFKLKEEKI